MNKKKVEMEQQQIKIHASINVINVKKLILICLAFIGI